MVQPIQTTGAMISLMGRPSTGRGRVSKGRNYIWNDIAFRRHMYGQARSLATATAAKAASVAKRNMQDLGGAHAPPGQYPAIQSGNLQNAIDSEFFYENRRWIVARFGVFGNVATRTQSSFDDSYDDETPVGVYAYTLATGVGRGGKKWPWVQKTLEEVADDGWVDAESIGVSDIIT